MQVNIDRGVTQPDTCQTTGDECAHETDREQHAGSKTDVTSPDRSDPVEHLDGRWYRNQ